MGKAGADSSAPRSLTWGLGLTINPPPANSPPLQAQIYMSSALEETKLPKKARRLASEAIRWEIHSAAR